MKPWNPYAMTLHGQPIVGQTPPKLVVYGPPLTARQGAMLQTAYNAFVGAARVSIVPNPSRQGRLTDGSPYTIECSGASCTCVVWTAGGEAQEEEAFSGILFWQAKIVLVNQGKEGEPSGKWGAKDMTGFPFSTAYIGWRPAIEPVPYGYGVSANVATTLRGKEKYTYRGEHIGRYGNITANHYGKCIGITSAKDALIMLESSATQARVLMSNSADVPKLFPRYGSAPTTPTSFEVAAGPSTVVLSATQPEGLDPRKKFVPYSCVASRDGKSLVYVEVTESGKIGPSDFVGGKAYVKRPHRNGASYYAHSGALYGTAPSSASPISYRSGTKRVFKSVRTGDTFPAGGIIYTVPEGEITATDHDYGGLNSMHGWVINHTNSSAKVTEKFAPKFVAYPWLETYPGSSAWVIRGSSVASGPISGALTRTEVLHDVSPHYVGNSLVLLGSTEEFAYTETCTGLVIYQHLNGYFAYGDFVNGAAPPLSDFANTVPTSPDKVDLLTDQQIDVSLKQNRYITLNDGRKFYTTRHEYTESGSAYEHEVHQAAGAGVTPYSVTYEGQTQYTVVREARILLAYDPENDLLCYQECTYSTTKAFSISRIATYDTINYTNSGGGEMPIPPDIKIIIECRGRTITLVRPFDTRDKRVLSLLPNIGISPYAVKDSSILTTGGFPGWPISNAFTPSAKEFNLYQGGGPLGDASFKDFRGLAPGIEAPTPTVEYIKTPETGGAYLRIFVEQDNARVVDRTFVVDRTGVRDIHDVLPDFDVGTEKGTPF